MLTFIYKTKKKDGMYLYLTKKDDFSQVPEQLMQRFGTPIFSMVVNLENRQLAQVDVEKVKISLEQEGYFLQIPPPIANLLSQYKEGKDNNENI